MIEKMNYNIDLNTKFHHLELIDVNAIVKATTAKWSNQTLTEVNNSVVRLGIIEGEFHWHTPDNDEESFIASQGQLLIDIESSTIQLNPNQGVTIYKGVLHRTRAPIKTVMLMVETNAIVPTGD